MDFSEKIKGFVVKIPKLSENVATEEATKNALIMPLLNMLGYNVFDPFEVVPEFTADHGTKKGEKVDYAIILNNKPQILIECKALSSDLNNELASQLFRYFSVTDAKVGVLTNGVKYRFFSDLDSPNRMDDKPFLEIDLLNLKDPQIIELKKFAKENFDPEGLTSTAITMKYTKEIKEILTNELSSPSEDFVRYFAKQIHSGPFTKPVRDKFTPITKNAFNQFINDKINERLQSALTQDDSANENNVESIEESEENPNDGIITTDEEWEGYYIVKAILHEIINPEKVAIRDSKSYCAILYEDNNRKPICRFYFNRNKKFVGFFDNNKNMEKIPIESLNELYQYSGKIKATANIYQNNK